MSEEDIMEVEKWIDSHEDDSTYTYDDKFVIKAADIDEFCAFIRQEFPDLLGIRSIVNSGGIWFQRSDLEDTRS